MADKHIGQFDLTREMLAQVLHLQFGMPADTEIVHVEINPHWSGQVREITLYVEHPDLPLVHEGEQMRRLIPTITEKDGDFLWSWGETDG